jgi:hypothetical protein
VAKADPEEGKIREIPSHPRGGGFKRFVVTVLILLAITWITLFFAVRTDGGRVLIEDHIETRFGIAVKIEKATLGFPLVLNLHGLAPEDVETTRSGFRAERVRISLGRRPRWRVSMSNPELNLLYARGAGWSPAVFRDIGDLPGEDVRHIAQLSEALRARISLRVQDGSIAWWDAAGNEMAFARGIQFTMAPAKVPDHRFTFYSLAVNVGVAPDAELFKEVRSEWLSSENHDYIEISRSESLPPDTESGFWGTQP